MNDKFNIVEPDNFFVFEVSCSCGTGQPPDFCEKTVWYYPCWSRKCYYLTWEPLEDAIIEIPEGD